MQEDSDGSQFEEYTIDVITYQVSAVEENKYPQQLFTSVKVNNAKDVTFQLDCGATCNLLSLKEFSSIMGDPKDLYLKKTSAILKMYNGTTVTPLGKCTLKCAKGEMSRDADFFIIDEDVRPLLGAETCQKLNLIKVMASDISESETVNAVNDNVQTAHIVLTRDQILKEYSDVFEGLGCMDGPYHMELDETVKSVVHPPRKVPVTLRDRLKEELDKLVREKVVTSVTEPTNWVSSLVLVNKPEKLRICIGKTGKRS